MKEEGMTREERNNKLKHFITCMKCEVSGKCCDENCPIQYDAGNMGEIIENLEEISKILEREPCEDAVSRKVVLDMMQMRMGAKELYKAVYDLPSVTPAPKKGKWIYSGSYDEEDKEEIIKGLESVKKECGKRLDEGFAWICQPIDRAIEFIDAEMEK